jgi:hypothetical protein
VYEDDIGVMLASGTPPVLIEAYASRTIKSPFAPLNLRGFTFGHLL